MLEFSDRNFGKARFCRPLFQQKNGGHSYSVDIGTNAPKKIFSCSESIIVTPWVVTLERKKFWEWKKMSWTWGTQFWGKSKKRKNMNLKTKPTNMGEFLVEHVPWIKFEFQKSILWILLHLFHNNGFPIALELEILTNIEIHHLASTSFVEMQQFYSFVHKICWTTQKVDEYVKNFNRF